MSKRTIIETHTAGQGAAAVQDDLPPADSIDPEAVPAALAPGAVVVDVQADPVAAGDPVSVPPGRPPEPPQAPPPAQPSKPANPHADGLWPVGYHASYDMSRRIP